MQAYFNALPARMAYEIGTQGVSASAVRFAQLIQRVQHGTTSEHAARLVRWKLRQVLQTYEGVDG